jgi:phosphate:Na+ symporter
MTRYVEAARLFLDIARRPKPTPGAAREHQNAIDILSRDIRRYTAAMFKPDMPYAQADMLASLVEEEDFTASLGETLSRLRALA